MKRSEIRRTVGNGANFKKRLLSWSAGQHTAIWMDSNGHRDDYGNFDALLAVGAASSLVCKEFSDAFDHLAAYQTKVKDWIFGYLSYDLKNDLENLVSENTDSLQFPELYFFQPQKIIMLRGKELTQLYLPEFEKDAENDLKAIKHQCFKPKNGQNKLNIEARISKSEYVQKVNEMQQHIHRGDIYEANFCHEFFANGNIAPLHTFRALNTISKAPFATYFKHENKHILCTSPERYLRKKGNKAISQPIKGTARRSKNRQNDAKIAQNLLKNEKERSENIMITDLVRNDLSRVAQKGSVQVEELCGLHSFKQVHQLISTISALVKPEIPVVEVIKNTFPMGSMTGAPKLASMKIIEKLEAHKRGPYSGAVGYFTPESDFDFNVIIRSILYDSQKKQVSFSVGSAITALSDPEQEYEECLLKARAMREVLSE